MASKTAQETLSTEEIEELLDAVDKTLDRLKTLYEQYFLGIQKQAPQFIHADVERKLRDLTQLQIRNTGLRYRFATLQQKFGAYNSYWRRTLRQIENGTYLRNLSKIGRQAAATGAEIPDEILAAMPKRMREQVLRDREVAIAAAARRKHDDDTQENEPIAHAPEPKREVRPAADGAFHLGADDDFDVDAFFKEVESNDEPAAAPVRATPKTVPPPQWPERAPQPTPPPQPAVTGAIPRIPTTPLPRMPTAPSQAVKPNPVAPGAAQQTTQIRVETMTGPFPRIPTGPVPTVQGGTGSGPHPRVQTGPVPRVPTTPPGPPPPPAARATQAIPKPGQTQPIKTTQSIPTLRPPPGMSDADVNALYQKYVKAKEMVGEQVGPNGRDKLLKTITAQAPKIMEQYNAKAVDFSVVVKDNQVIIRAKPKT